MNDDPRRRSSLSASSNVGEYSGSGRREAVKIRLYPFDPKSTGDFVGAPGTRESPACFSPAVTAMPISIGRIEAIFRYP